MVRIILTRRILISRRFSLSKLVRGKRSHRARNREIFKVTKSNEKVTPTGEKLLLSQGTQNYLPPPPESKIELHGSPSLR